MSNTLIARLFGALVLAAVPLQAFAQQELCRRLRAELAALDQAGGGRAQQFEAAAARQRAEISRTAGYFRSIGCEGRGFTLFNSPPPPECGALAARLEQMQANHARLAQQAERAGGGSPERRMQLAAAVQQACRVQEAAPRGNGLYETLFGSARPTLEDVPSEVIDDSERRPRGGGKAVCVRTCDGFFFPISTLPGGRESADEMCQALCPGTEARAYFMPGGDGTIEQGVSVRGEPYTSLPNASRFQKTFDPSCSCRQKGQSWVQALRSAEDMIERRKGDIIVTAQKAEELSRAKVASAPKDAKTAKAEALKAEAARLDAAAKAEVDAVASTAAAAPTASTESSGIGPRAIEQGRVVAQGDGARRELTEEDGTKRKVRIIAPDLVAPLLPKTQ